MTDNPKPRSNKVNLEHSPQYLFVHDKKICLGEYCTVHRRSDHAMRSFPQNWRWDRGLMERICPHMVGHPDPDEIGLTQNGRGVHGCDGCCSAQGYQWGMVSDEQKQPCSTHVWYNLPGNYTRKCDNCELEENLW